MFSKDERRKKVEFKRMVFVDHQVVDHQRKKIVRKQNKTIKRSGTKIAIF